jgi:hypothetical protein
VSFRSFGDWLAAQLRRPPVVGDLDVDVIAAYGLISRSAAAPAGVPPAGDPAAPTAARVYLSMLRAVAREPGRGAEVDGVRIPRHEPGPLTDVDYANLLRVPDRRTLAGKRDYALLGGASATAVCGRPSYAVCALPICTPPRANARHFRMFVRGREVPVPEATQRALKAWTAVHPLARGVALPRRAAAVRRARPPRP